MKEFIVPESISKERMSVCEKCDSFFKLTKQCLECGCFVSLKTKLSNQHCPKNKWSKYKRKD